MKKFLGFVIFLSVVGLVIILFAKDKITKDFTRPVPYPTSVVSPSVSPQQASTPEKESMFVPYWSLKADVMDTASYSSYIYFGVQATKDGLDIEEAGGKSLPKFLAFVPKGSQKLLAIRMIDSQTNFAILKDTASQKKVIEQAVALAQEKGFDGIVLDLEVSAIPFDSLVKQISVFMKQFSEEVKQNDLSFAQTIYGDVFYRVRPFDVKELATYADEVMIMAYDFSKAKGNPGPNFPLKGEETYGYDYKKLTEHLLRVMPAQKITVIFGMFGYDWLVDGQGRNLAQGKAISTTEVENNFITSCKEQSCSFSRDEKAFETQIHYVHKDGSKHIIWFEDMESVKAKKAYLKTQGINSFSYWAYSYF